MFRLPSIKEMRESPDIYLARLGIVLGLLCTILSLFGQKSLVAFGLLSAFVSAFYLLYVKKVDTTKEIGEQGLSPVNFLVLSIVFTVLLALSIWFSINNSLSLAYYLITTLAYGVIILQVLLMHRDQKAILYTSITEVISISLLVRFAQVYAYPALVGVDPWVGLAVNRDILTYGYLPARWTYSSFPLYHTGVAVFNLITGLSFKDSLVWSIGLVEVLSLMITFLLGQFIGGNKVGLLSLVFLSFTDAHIEWGGRSLIAMSLAIVYFSFIVYLILKTVRRRPITLSIVILVSMVCLIMTHTLTSLILAIVLVSFYAGFVGHRIIFGKEAQTFRGSRMNLNIVILFGVLTLSYWMYASGFFIEIGKVLKYALDVTRGELVPTLVMPQFSSLIETITNQAQFLIITELTLLGVLFWLAKKFRTPEKMMLLSFIIMIMVISQLNDYTDIDVLLPDRWIVFYYLGLAVLIAFALVEVARVFRLPGAIGSTVVLTALGFTMLTSLTANIQPPLFSTTARNAFLEPEVAATTSTREVFSGTIITDGDYYPIWEYEKGYKTFLFVESFTDERYFRADALYVVRSYITTYSVVTEDTTTSKEVGYTGNRLTIGGKITEYFSGGNYDKVYTNNQVSEYRLATAH